MITPAYLAGFFDGEGYVGAILSNGGTSYTIKVTISNTNLAILELIKKDYGGSVMARKKMKSYHIQAFFIQWNGEEAKNVLKTMLPYLVVKKEQAELAQEFPLYRYGQYNDRSKKEKQKEIYAKLIEMKRKQVDIPQQCADLQLRRHEEKMRKKQIVLDLVKEMPLISMREIAERTGLTMGAVWTYIKDLNRPNVSRYHRSPRHTDYLKKVEAVKELHENEPELTTREIAKRLGVSHGNVSRYLTGKKYNYYLKQRQ